MRGRADSKEGKVARDTVIIVCAPAPAGGPVHRCASRACSVAPLLLALSVLCMQVASCAARKPAWATPVACSAGVLTSVVAVTVFLLLMCVPAVALAGLAPPPTIDPLRDNAQAMRAFHWATRATGATLAGALVYIMAAHVHDIAAFHIVIRLGVLHSLLAAAFHLYTFVRLYIILPAVGRCAARPDRSRRREPVAVEMIRWPSNT